MDYKVISGDSHIDLRWLPADLFVSNSVGELKDLMPQVKETEDGPRWFAEGGNIMGRPGAIGVSLTARLPGQSKRVERMFEAGFYDGQYHPSTPDLRIKDQDVDGIDAEVIYGVLGMAAYIENPEVLRSSFEIYNSWAADFCKTKPGRFVALACIPNDDPEIAAIELRRASRLGLKGAEFAPHTSVKPIWHRDWDVLWAAAAECNMPISFHTLGYKSRPPTDERMATEYSMQYRATNSALFQMSGAEYLSAIIFSGALDRHPGFKFVLGECGVGWIPYVLARMDDEYEDQFHELNFSMKPSDFWRRQGFTTYQHETIVADVVHLVGEDNILWGSDYPHPDGVWPDSAQMIAEDLGRLDERVRRKIICENTGKLYGLLQ